MTPWVVAGICLIAAAVLSSLWWRARAEAEAFAARLFSLTPDPPAKPDACRALAQKQKETLKTLRIQVAQLEQQEGLFQALLSLLDAPVIVVDAEGCLVQWNAAAGALLHGAVSTRRGVRLRDVVSSFALIDAMTETLRTGEPQEAEGEVGPGRQQVFAIQVLPLTRAEETQALILLTDRSSTAAFRELRREFVTNVTHELKTPLTNIVGATETLLSGAMEEPEFRGRFLEIIQRNADQLRALIEDLLLIARSEEEAAPMFEAEECEYRSVREMVLNDLASAAEAADVSLRAQPLAGNVPLPFAAADCYTILKNLTENAIRYNKRGGIVEFSERLLDDALEVSIRDTGIGLSPADQARVWERFYRADKQRSREQGGTGLGLAIVKNLVERHGGQVDVMSKPGLGSTFVITLPRVSPAGVVLTPAAE